MLSAVIQDRDALGDETKVDKCVFVFVPCRKIPRSGLVTDGNHNVINVMRA